jgi:hypothetical protein
VRDPVLSVIRFASGSLLLALLVVATHVNVSDPATGAILGVAVRTMAGTVQDCRTLSDEELAALPQHMRRKEICETHAVPYRLEVRLDGEKRLDRVYTAAGIHGDRPITVDERIGVAAGLHDLSIRLAPAEPTGTASLPVFTFERSVELEEGRIRVAWLDGVTGPFEIR